MKTIYIILLLTTLACAEDTLRLYISADRTGAAESGVSIEQGVRTSLAMVNNRIGSIYIEVVLLDHRGSTPRFEQHCKQYLEDEKALVLMGGLHSPPLLSQRDFINENSILTLVPWAAATPITRYPQKKNWIFRLSIDDSKAGKLISDFAVNEGYKNPVLLLEETGWGKSNEKTMTHALAKQGIKPVKIEWFNWNIGINQAKVLLRNIHELNADVIYFVGNANEGKSFAKAMSELKAQFRTPIRSHWGITGGDFPDVIDSSLRDSIDLLFIQTSFSFFKTPLPPYAEQVFKKASQLYKGEIDYYSDIKAPSGFIHSYDITQILIQAMKELPYRGEIHIYRDEIRKKLENMTEPVQGLIKVYVSPFSQWTADNSNAHEALGPRDWTMARYRSDNSVELLTETSRK